MSYRRSVTVFGRVVSDRIVAGEGPTLASLLAGVKAFTEEARQILGPEKVKVNMEKSDDPTNRN